MKKRMTIGISLTLVVALTSGLIAALLIFKTDNYTLIQDAEFLCVTGEFTKSQIASSEDAVQEVQTFCIKNGFSNAAEALSLQSEITVGQTTYYRLQQNYKDIPVYGRAFVVVADNSGNALGLTGNAIDIPELDTDPTISSDDLHDIVCNYFRNELNSDADSFTTIISPDCLIIYSLTNANTYSLAYQVEAAADNTTFEFIVDAHDGSVLHYEIKTVSASVNCYIGDNKFTGYCDAENRCYRMYDQKRNIYILSGENTDLTKEGSTQTLIVSKNNIFGDTAEEENLQMDRGYALLTATQKAYDFFNEAFNDAGIGCTLAFYNDGCSNGTYPYSLLAETSSENLQNNNGFLPDYVPCGVISFGTQYDYNAIDIIGHEYTHNIEQNRVGMVYAGESGAIMEAYSDIFGEIIESWDSGNRTFEACNWENVYRNIKDPLQSGCPAVKNGKNWLTTITKENNDNGNVHNNSTVISHAAYLMSTGVNGSHEKLSLNTLSALWYNTLLTLPKNCTFDVLRTHMIMVANNEYLGLSESQKACILAAFDSTGITGVTKELVSNDLRIHVVDIDQNSYDDYTILVAGQEYSDLFKLGWTKREFSETYTNTNTIHLNNGEYTIKIIDNQNSSNTASLSVKVKKGGETNKLTFLLQKNPSDSVIEDSPADVVEIEVVDALNYEKNVITTDIVKDMGMNFDDQKHKIRIPKITSNSENACAFNEKIYQQFYDKYEILLSNQERAAMYNIDYTYKQYRDVLGIVVTYSHFVQAGGGNYYYYVYYYDLKNDKEINLDQYLSAFDHDRYTLMSVIQNTDEYTWELSYVSDPSNISLKDCIIDSDGAIVILNNLESMDGYTKLELDAFPFGNSSDSVVTPDTASKFTWSFNQTTGILTLSGTGNMPNYHCDINPAPWQTLFYSDAVKHIVIEDGITSIGSYTCWGATESVTIPKSVSHIEFAAIESAPVKTIYYHGTASDWNKITIDPYNFENSDANIVCLENHN